jgi:hypothetical protein
MRKTGEAVGPAPIFFCVSEGLLSAQAVREQRTVEK